MKGDLWIVGASLDAKVSVGAIGVKALASKRRERHQFTGTATGEAEAVSFGGEQAWAEADRDR